MHDRKAQRIGLGSLGSKYLVKAFLGSGSKLFQVVRLRAQKFLAWSSSTNRGRILFGSNFGLGARRSWRTTHRWRLKGQTRPVLGRSSNICSQLYQFLKSLIAASFVKIKALVLVSYSTLSMSTEEAFLILTKWPWVWFLAFLKVHFDVAEINPWRW